MSAELFVKLVFSEIVSSWRPVVFPKPGIEMTLAGIDVDESVRQKLSGDRWDDESNGGPSFKNVCKNEKGLQNKLRLELKIKGLEMT